jgi:hypothetical protein
MKRMFASLLVESHLVTPQKHVDWIFVLSWAGVITALCIELAVR